MTKRSALVVASIVWSVLGITLVEAQQPAGAGGTGRCTPPDPSPLSVVQQLALNREMTTPPVLAASAIQAAAASALVRASLTLPISGAEMTARAKDLADAELALASARATAFERVQKSLQPLSTAQVTTYARNPGGGMAVAVG